MTTTYTQTEPNFIGTHTIQEDGSISTGVVRRFETRTRTIQDGTEEVLVGTEQVQTGTESISVGFDESGVELFEEVPIFTEQDVFENQPKYIEQSYSPWDEMVAADLAGDISVTWLDEAVYTAEQDAIAAQQATEAATKAAKMLGIAYSGVDVSLTEANQNGLAAVMSGEALAVDFGGSIFPLNFSAETATGFQTIAFATLADFKTFALSFMSARQQFFQ